MNTKKIINNEHIKALCFYRGLALCKDSSDIREDKLDIMAIKSHNVSMNRNNSKIDKLPEIAKVIKKINTEKEAVDFLEELLTNAEAETLSKRWRILEMLIEGETQRGIAKELRVSLCKVTRGSRLLKNKNSILAKHLIKDKK